MISTAALTLAAALAAMPQETREFSIPSTDSHVVNGQVDLLAGAPRGAVILVAGTGAFDRDVSLGVSGTERDKLFADLGARFAARGLAAVRYDRRGVRHGRPPAEALDMTAWPTLTAEGFSEDVGAVDAWARSSAGLGATCVVYFVHSEGAVHLAGRAEAGMTQPNLIIGMGAPLESKKATVRWQLSGRDADSLEMMDANGDGQVTNEEVQANWMRTPSAVFGSAAPFIQPDGVWTAGEIAMVRTVQGGLYEQTRATVLETNDADPYPNAQAPAFSQGWWKSWFVDDTPLAVRYAHWSTSMILHYGEIDSQVREARQRAAAEGVLAPGQATFVSHPGVGHSLGAHVLMGPVDETIADRMADEAAAACS